MKKNNSKNSFLKKSFPSGNNLQHIDKKKSSSNSYGKLKQIKKKTSLSIWNRCLLDKTSSPGNQIRQITDKKKISSNSYGKLRQIKKKKKKSLSNWNKCLLNKASSSENQINISKE